MAILSVRFLWWARTLVDFPIQFSLFEVASRLSNHMAGQGHIWVNSAYAHPPILCTTEHAQFVFWVWGVPVDNGRWRTRDIEQVQINIRPTYEVIMMKLSWRLFQTLMTGCWDPEFEPSVEEIVNYRWDVAIFSVHFLWSAHTLGGFPVQSSTYHGRSRSHLGQLAHAARPILCNMIWSMHNLSMCPRSIMDGVLRRKLPKIGQGKKRQSVQQDLNPLHSVPHTRAQALSHHRCRCWPPLFQLFYRQTLYTQPSPSHPTVHV